MVPLFLGIYCMEMWSFSFVHGSNSDIDAVGEPLSNVNFLDREKFCIIKTF
jgi:hypothetical protein